MNLNTMLRRNIFPFVLLAGTLCAELVCAQTDGDALFREARTKIVESIAKLPRYTCIQTIRRSRFDPFYESRKKGCGERQNVWLSWTDQLKLDVTISEGAEIFSRAGAREFQSPDAQTIAGNGLTSTGDFGHFLMTILEAMIRWRINTSDSSKIIMDRAWPCTNIACRKRPAVTRSS
jgi:hypothetical protein